MSLNFGVTQGADSQPNAPADMVSLHEHLKLSTFNYMYYVPAGVQHDSESNEEFSDTQKQDHSNRVSLT